MLWLAGGEPLRRRRSRRRDGQADAVARRSRSPGDGGRAAPRDDRAASRRRFPGRRPSREERRRSRSRHESADVVTVAQAFHWFDHGPALARSRGCCGPGGRIALVWNVRDESEPWVSELSDAMVGRTGLEYGATEPIVASGLFEPVEHAVFSHVHEVDREMLQELVRSRSYCAVLSEEERAPVLQNVDDLFTEHARDGVLRAAVPDRVLPRDPAVSPTEPGRPCPPRRSRTTTCRSSSSGRPTRRASGWQRCPPGMRRRSRRTGRGIRSNPDSTLRTIVADGVVVGNAVSWTGDEGRMVGYWIGKEHWGRGIASAALASVPRGRSAPAPARDRRRAQRGLAPRAGEGRLPARGAGARGRRAGVGTLA